MFKKREQKNKLRRLISRKAQMCYLQISILIIASFAFAFLLAPNVKAEASAWPAFNVCCERTKTGAWCQNTLEENCDKTLRVTPASCDATSFCKPGCCYDSQQGLCMERTPQKVCNDQNGTYIDEGECNIPQCSLGCCLIGTQASFVTLTRCKMLSGLYGLETNFRKDITNEGSCIATAIAQDEGACVYEVDYQRTCKFTTRGECLSTKSGGNMTSSTEFFQNYLCSAEELATNCGPSTKTTCIQGRDEVYFLDTCGNTANIYDASKLNDKSYWQKKIDKSASCNYNNQNANAGSKTCGNCDYFQGSICSKGSASYGNYICKDLNCYDTENGNDYKNGESWCIYDSKVGEGKDLVGSRHFRHVCIYGEEIIEPCADFRNEQCIQANIESEGVTFTEAACRVNRWQDCIDQNEEEKCLNIDKRDCFWLEGASIPGAGTGAISTAPSSTGVFGAGKTGGFSGGLTGKAIFGGEEEEETKEISSGVQLGGGACLPNVPPGLKFWSDGDAKPICSLGNSKCVVVYEKKLLGSKKCVENCECLEESYAQQMNRVCTSIGDCGAYTNIANRFTDDGAEWKVDGKKKTITQGILGNLNPIAGDELASQKPSILEGLGNLLEKLSFGIGLVSGATTASPTYSQIQIGDQIIKPGTNINLINEKYWGMGDSETINVWFGANGKLYYQQKEISVQEFENLKQSLGDLDYTEIDYEMSSALPGGSVNTVKISGIETSISPSATGTLPSITPSGPITTPTPGVAKDSQGDTVKLPAQTKTPEQIAAEASATKIAGLKSDMRFTLNGKSFDLVQKDGKWGYMEGKDFKALSDADIQNMQPAGKWTAITSAFTDNLLSNAITSLTVAGLAYGAASILGMSSDNSKAVFLSTLMGTMTYKVVGQYLTKTAQKGLFGTKFLSPGIAGIGVGLLIFIMMYKKTDTETVEFNCLPYQPPTGGADCELCNEIQGGCSEYRCKSLGQACQLLNAGTTEEKCAWVNPHDVNSPLIKIGSLLKGYIWKPDKAVRPPATGVVISQEDGSCVEAFTPLEFNLATDEPSQCKIDYNLTKGFDEMNYYVGGDSLFSYNHTEMMSLPGPDTVNKIAPELKNDGTYTLYIRCQDANGNFNQDAFSVRFCVKPGPDTTPPRIVDVSNPSNSPIQFNKSSLDIEVYVNEPAECKWSREDRTFDNMENTMACSTNLWEMNNNNVYTCKTTLTGIKDRVENDFYFRCRDVSEKLNVNTQSYKYTIIGTQPLSIMNVGPNETIRASTKTIPVELYVKTDYGYRNGEAICYYSNSTQEKDYIQFLETGTNEHTQRQDLTTGNYKYYFKCVDLGGNAAYNSTTFSVEVDESAPTVVRVYKEGSLKIITNEKSICSYSIKDCNFEIKDGIAMPYDNQEAHTAEWKSQNYYIRCKDGYDNQPDPNTCSIIVKPYNLGENVIEL